MHLTHQTSRWWYCRETRTILLQKHHFTPGSLVEFSSFRCTRSKWKRSCHDFAFHNIWSMSMQRMVRRYWEIIGFSDVGSQLWQRVTKDLFPWTPCKLSENLRNNKRTDLWLFTFPSNLLSCFSFAEKSFWDSKNSECQAYDMLLATLKYGRISKTQLITEVAEASGLPRRELEDQGLDCSSSAMSEIDHQIQDSECYFARFPDTSLTWVFQGKSSSQKCDPIRCLQVILE